MTQWRLQPILDSYLLVLVVALALIGMLALRPNFGSLNKKRKTTLLVLRGAVAAILTLAMLNPTRITTDEKPQTLLLLLLLDQSRSMEFPDASGQRSRWEAMKQTLEGVRSQLGDMGQAYDVKAYFFDGQLHEAELQAGALGWPAAPTGELTDIAGSLQQTLRENVGRRLAGVVLASDGVQTSFNPQTSLYEVGRELARLGAPLYGMPLGPAGDVEQGRDVAVESLPEQYTVFVKNELVVRGVIRARGYSGRAIPVELIAEDPSGAQSVVQQRTLTMGPQQESQIPVELLFTPQEPGPHKLVLRAAGQPGELVVKNNELATFVNVLSGGLRIAYLYGDRLGEQRALRWSLESSPDIEMDALFIDRRQRRNWPLDRGEFFVANKYDVFLVENLDSAALQPANWQSLEEQVGQGKGLMMIGGYSSFGGGGFQETPLRDVLPVVMDRLERQEVDIRRPVSRDLHMEPTSGLQMAPAMDHSILQLAPGDRNASVWRSLPPLLGANRLTPKPQAQVLAVSQNQEPLLISGEYGAGRVLAFAGDSTRLWWQHGREAEHKRFWRQVVLWLARRDGLEQNDVWVRLPRRRFEMGEKPEFTAGANTAAGETIPDAELEVTLVDPAGQQRAISLTQGEEDFMGIIDQVVQPGDYSIQVLARRNGQSLGSAKAGFTLLDRDVELLESAADAAQLQRLASETREAGGSLIAAEELPRILQNLADNPPPSAVQFQTRWQPGSTTWDAWLIFLTLVALWSGDWALRKKWGLV